MAEGKWRSSDGRQPPPVSMNLAVGKRPRSDYAARGNSSAVNPLVTQLTNGPLGGLHEKFVDSVLLRYI
ncbi:hypothetical protein ACFX2C_006253 [Malus domestica]